MIKDFVLKFKKQEMGVGRRKKATARVFFQYGTGNLVINNIRGKKYLQDNLIYFNKILEPLKTFKKEKIFDIIVLVNGGGLVSQTTAIQLGVSKLLFKIYPENKGLLKKKGFLTQDSRVKERKKYGLRKARKAPQFSKR